MSSPRQIVPGRIYLITRRCAERRFFLRPDALTTSLFQYAFAEAALRFRIRVIAWLAMSNHYHAVVEDLDGNLPAFLCQFHKMAARSLNRRWGRAENFWSAEAASVVRLVKHEDVLDKTIYALVNPIAAHLVARMVDWPGASSFAHLDGAILALERPTTFYREHGTMPEKIELRAEAPTNWPGGANAWIAAVRAGVERRVAEINAERIAAGVPVMGARAVLELDHEAKPQTREQRRGLRPELACLDTERRCAELGALSRFRAAYAAAREAFLQGVEALFPWGTYKLVRDLGVATYPDPDPAPA